MTSHIYNRDSRISFLYMLALCLPVTIACIDVMAVSVAIAPIMKHYSSSLQIAQWLLSGYTIGTAAFLITIGGLADKYGRRRVLLVGVWMFALASFIASISPGIYYLIASRFLQGVASSIMMTTVMSIITHEFAPADRGKVISTYGISLGLGLASGPAIGGLLIAYLNWRAIFLINLPICVIAVWLVMKYLPESKNEQGSSCTDWLETTILVLLLLLVVLIISQGGMFGWLSSIMSYFYAVLMILMAIFLYIERSKINPIIDITLFKQPNYFGATICGFLSYFCMYAWLCIIGIYLQDVGGMTAMKAGLFCTPFSLAFAFSSKALTHLFKRYTNKLIMQVGFISITAAFLWMATITPLTYQVTMLMMFFLLGIGITVVNTPSMVVATEHVPLNKTGLASGLIFTIRWLGGSIGVATITLIYRGFSESLTYSCLALAFTALLGLVFTFTLKYSVVSS